MLKRLTAAELTSLAIMALALFLWPYAQEAFMNWWNGDLDSIFGVSKETLARIAKILLFLAGLTIVADIAGTDYLKRLRRWGDETHEGQISDFQKRLSTIHQDITENDTDLHPAQIEASGLTNLIERGHSWRSHRLPSTPKKTGTNSDHFAHHASMAKIRSNSNYKLAVSSIWAWSLTCIILSCISTFAIVANSGSPVMNMVMLTMGAALAAPILYVDRLSVAQIKWMGFWISTIRDMSRPIAAKCIGKTVHKERPDLKYKAIAASLFIVGSTIDLIIS
ncbi:hypothetical protein Q8791_23425 [Nocardiopsis sp. CT-R113]|uniref:Transmembrane protein n=1 Tax=Nocardiopsis codii TaxID=3065942 RepID=A0ABU7KD91_9ACTN|nr:hypothetical protein [Nocardiopsis sp. CT-R113]MEE2040172.1 hypothetical protein [Nocardiopsis sp. CT-R113]